MHTDSQLGVLRKHATNISTSVSVGCHCTSGHLFLHHHYYLVILFFSGPVATRQSQRQWGGLGTGDNTLHYHKHQTLRNKSNIFHLNLRQIEPHAHALNFNFLMKSNPMIYLLYISIIQNSMKIKPKALFNERQLQSAPPLNDEAIMFIWNITTGQFP